MSAKIVRLCMKNAPAWIMRKAEIRSISNRPQAAFLPLVEDHGLIPAAHQPSLSIKAPEEPKNSKDATTVESATTITTTAVI